MTDLTTRFAEAWETEVSKREAESPSFTRDQFVATGRASAKHGGCVIDGCERKHNARGLCGTHYRRWRIHGNPLHGDDYEARLRARFAKYTVLTEDGCWLWTSTLVNGYGKLYARGRDNQKAHRVAYELLVGPIPEGLDLDHLCRNRACVNPDHLEPVTRRENLVRAVPYRKDTRKTHCPSGHEYAGENLIIAKSGEQQCRTCRKAHQRRYRAERREAS